MPTDPPEPTHPLDAGLRAQAARRRAELGVEEPAMPGPMRTQLQSEVARQFAGAVHPRAERPGFLAWFFQWQRALATVGVTALLLGFFAWNGGWLSPAPMTGTKQVAVNEAAPAPVQREAAAIPAGREEAPAVAPAPEALAKRADEPAADRDAKEQTKAKAPVAAAAPPTDVLLSGKVVTAPKPAAVAPAPPAEKSAKGVAGAPVSPRFAEPRTEEFASTTAPARLRQNFAQTPAQALDRNRKLSSKDERTAQLLNEFEFRQSGNRVEIVESDGSVYSGEIEVTKRDALPAKNRAKKVAEAKDIAAADKVEQPTEAQGSEVAAEFNFKASGVSNTLRQKVTIEGVYQAPGSALQNAPGASPAGGMANQRAADAGRAQSQQAQSRARVVGRAQVNGRDLEVEAEATK